MRLNDFRIGTRLALVFGFIVALCLLSGLLAVYELDRIEHNLDDIVNDNNVKIRLAHDMNDAAHELALALHAVALPRAQSQAHATHETAHAPVADAREHYRRAWDALGQLSTSETGRAHRARIEAAASAAEPVNDRVLALAKAGSAAEAAALLLEQAAPATRTWQRALDEAVAYEEENSRAQYERAGGNYRQARALLMAASAACVVLATLLGWLTMRSIVRPLAGAREAASRMARGDLAVALSPDGRDEIALLVRALQEMKDAWVAIVADVRRNAEEVATASAQIATGNNDLSSRTEQQASALEETAASMEQLGATVKQNAQNAREASALAAGASDVAERGGTVVGQVVDKMRGIDQSAKRIADIIGVIDGIAFQTNILALNAAVEAARAGEHGRGFAVVAGEVQTLARRSAEAAKEIKTLIGTSVQTVEQGTALVDQAGATMGEVVAAVRRVNQIIAEISGASAEQSAGVGQVGEAVSQMDRATQQNAALVEESAAAAQSLREQAQQLVQAVSVFRLEAA